VGNWEAQGRLPLDIMLARLNKIALDAAEQKEPNSEARKTLEKLAAVFMGGLEELKQDRAQKAADIFEEIQRWHDIRGHLEALCDVVETLRKEKLTDAELPQRLEERLKDFATVLAAAQRWSWRNR
jgi:hypothetical protein